MDSNSDHWRELAGVEYRSKGRPSVFESPEDIVKMAMWYIDWAKENPQKKGEEYIDRPLLIREMCSEYGIGYSTWRDYCNKPNFSEVCEWVTDKIEMQKLSGALVGVYPHQLVARILGIAEVKSVEHSGEVNTPAIDPSEYKEIRKQVLANDDC